MSTPSQTIDIDALLQNTWLQVISLRHGPEFTEDGGLTLWQRCVADAEHVQRVLREAGVSREGCHDILLAQCALLDEAVKGRGVQDDACLQWYHMPLQGHFLHTMDAGETLCDRMQQVLAQPEADPLVLTCFHRVMLLGFLGGYASADAPARQQLMTALAKRVPPFTRPADAPLLSLAHGGLSMGWLSLWPVRIGLTALLLAALWWGLNHWLDHLITTLLPGVKG
ncbi:type VI secretion system protein TssL, short form [Candidatus Pantoea floridensis]|uniref:Type VI secretion system protein ImpK n=1 Tax=Candidatus Pantoea floridensis TaxID=1938870 RepID=A0A286BYE3_9GAMM|nr:type VI secretion system protein TssL, short form [Pantoea floridensis]PIF21648.1 type VI secretion system protein ImpK [Enterobacteriaceae bacterium JKS000233]SOD39159.1 type VI secretion system protein ImpK [Pantoea floridensis]